AMIASTAAGVVARLRVMRFAVDVAAQPVACMVDARGFASADMAVAHGAIFHAVDAMFLGLQARGFLARQRAGTIALLDSVFLDVFPARVAEGLCVCRRDEKRAQAGSCEYGEFVDGHDFFSP